ncbi:MAG: deoxynucleoside kinase [Polyangia bacterium]
MFIVIEGLDGTGKTTLGEKLASQLDAKYLKTPPDEIADIRNRLEDVLGSDPVSRQLFYASCVAAISSRVKEIVASGSDVVVDRYWMTTCVYAPLYGEPVDLRNLEMRLVVPDVTFFLDVDEQERVRRLTVRGRTSADLDSVSYHGRLREDYLLTLDQARAGRVIVIDTSRLSATECLRKAVDTLFGRDT